MIQINRAKVVIPNSLVKPNNQFRENDYKKTDVRSAMKTMQYHKCCYCERNLKKEDEIEKEGEHFIPRSSDAHKVGGIKQWHLVNNWNNLMLSCRACNGTKLAKPPFDNQGVRQIIDPSDLTIDPENEIKFNLKIDIHSEYDLINSTVLGVSTINKIGLYKRTFLRGKFRKIRALINGLFDDLITEIENEDQDSINQILNNIRDYSKASKSHSAFCRAVIEDRLLKLNLTDIPFLANRHGIIINPINIQLHTGYDD